MVTFKNLNLKRLDVGQPLHLPQLLQNGSRESTSMRYCLLRILILQHIWNYPPLNYTARCWQRMLFGQPLVIGNQRRPRRRRLPKAQCNRRGKCRGFRIKRSDMWFERVENGVQHEQRRLWFDRRCIGKGNEAHGKHNSVLSGVSLLEMVQVHQRGTLDIYEWGEFPLNDY